MKATKCFLPLFLVFLGIFGVSKLHCHDIIYEPIFYTLDAYFDLSESLEKQTLPNLIIEKVSNIMENLQETISRHLVDAFASRKKETNSEIDKLKSRYNFASINGGAKIIETRPSIKIGKSILDDNVDNYALYDCTIEPLEIVISLTEDVLVDTLMVLNLENHASFFKDFEVLISTKYDSAEWLSVGLFQTSNKKEWQYFKLPQKWARYVKLKLLSHSGGESLCTITQIKVLGVTMLENFRDEFLVKEDFFSSEILSGMSNTHHKPQPEEPEETIFADVYSRNNISPNPSWSFSEFLDQSYSKYENIDEIEYVQQAEIELSDDACDVFDYFTQPFCNTIKQTRMVPMNINYKDLFKTPKTIRNFRIFATKLLEQLFGVSLEIQVIKDQSTQLAQRTVSPLMRAITQAVMKNRHHFENTMSYTILNEAKKGESHESIFKSLTRKLKGLEMSLVLIETYIAEFKDKAQEKMAQMAETIQALRKQNENLNRTLDKVTRKNDELEKRIENLEKTVHEINSPYHNLSKLSLIILLFLVLNIVWKILEKAAFAPAEQQKKVFALHHKSISNKEYLTPNTPKGLTSKRKNKTSVSFKEIDSPRSGIVSNPHSFSDLTSGKVLRRSKSPTSGPTGSFRLAKGK